MKYCIILLFFIFCFSSHADFKLSCPGVFLESFGIAPSSSITIDQVSNVYRALLESTDVGLNHRDIAQLQKSNFELPEGHRSEKTLLKEALLKVKELVLQMSSSDQVELSLRIEGILLQLQKQLTQHDLNRDDTRKNGFVYIGEAESIQPKESSQHILAVAVSPDGRYIAYLDGENRFFIYDRKAPQNGSRWQWNAYSRTGRLDLQFSSSGNLVFNAAEIHDLSDRKNNLTIGDLYHRNDTLGAVFLAHDTRLLVVVYNSIQILSSQDGKPLRSHHLAYDEELNLAAISNDKKYIVGLVNRTGRSRPMLSLFNIDSFTPEEPKPIELPDSLHGSGWVTYTYDLKHLAVGVNGNLVILGYKSGLVVLFNLRTKKIIRFLTTPIRQDGGGHEAVTTIALSENDKTLAIGMENGTIQIWDLENLGKPKPIGEIRVHRAAVTQIVFSAATHSMISASNDGNVVIFDVND